MRRMKMLSKIKKALEAYGFQAENARKLHLIKDVRELIKPEEPTPDDRGDVRYNQPKEAPKASEELVDETIEDTEIYKRAKERVLQAQRKQVAYGLDKYPTPLNADVWDILETIDHIIDEGVDKLHYLIMLQIHLERMAEREAEMAEEEARDMMNYVNSINPKNSDLADTLNYQIRAGADLDGDIITTDSGDKYFIDPVGNISLIEKSQKVENVRTPNIEKSSHNDKYDALAGIFINAIKEARERGVI
jgi:hypothetical protein